MKNRKKVILFFVCGLLLLTGCGKQEKVPKAASAAPENLYPRELSNEELREFTMWINKGGNYGNYGFLLSEYKNPQDMNLYELFYAGAGMECKRLSPEEQAAYLKATGQEEIYTDCTRLTTAQIDEFLQRKTGLAYEDMAHPLDWVYLPEYDIYVNEHGDTNYMNFTCVSGRQTDEDTYELDCVPGDDTYTPLLSSCQFTLKRAGEDYQPVSNVYVEGLTYSMDIWRIDDQCFDVELDGWGEVTFASYGQDKSAYGYKDAVFKLEKNGEELYQFPFVREENYRIGESFLGVLAVSFQDYNGDGKKDIIVIAEYKSEVGAAEGECFNEVRLYRNRPENQDFVLDFDRMDILNGNQWNHTIGEVMEHMSETWNAEGNE